MTDRQPTPRGARTRAALVRAAREVFERDGFVGARIVDIAAGAGVATGTFYTWFRTKGEVFAAVVAELTEDQLHHQGPGGRGRGGDPVAAIAAANRDYLAAYKDNARLMAVLDQVAAVDPDVRRARMARARAFTERNARAIARLQARGLADPALDPRTTSVALSEMVSRTAAALATGELGLDDDTVARTLDRLWANALCLPAAEPR